MFPDEDQDKINDLLAKGAVKFKDKAEKAKKDLRSAIPEGAVQNQWLRTIEYLYKNKDGKTGEDKKAYDELMEDINKYIDLFSSKPQRILKPMIADIQKPEPKPAPKPTPKPAPAPAPKPPKRKSRR